VFLQQGTKLSRAAFERHIGLVFDTLGGLDVPTSGTLSYAGNDLSHSTEEQLSQYRRLQLGFIAQIYKVLEVLDRVNRYLGTSVAIVTHNAPIASIADRVVTLADGRIASDQANATRKARSEVSW
jgi:ABC-type lipoprotein export system ATPase subunit